MRKIAAKSAKTLSDEELIELKKNASGVLFDTRRNLLNRFPFVGTIAMSLDVVPVRDIRLDTAATDGQAIYFDIDFLSQLTNDERMFVMAHEIYHNVMLHPMREEKRDHQLWNIASDIEVNEMLIKDGLACLKNACTCKTCKVPFDKSAEEYFELLLKKAKKNQNKSGNSGKNFINSNAQNNSSGNSNNQNDVEGSEGQFDKHLSKDYDKETDKQPEEYEIQDKYGKVGEDKDFRPKVTESAVEKIREAAVSAAQQIERQRGELPAHLKRLIDNLLEPKLNWRELLASFVTKTVGQNRTWNRPNRRFAYTGTYLPSTIGEKIKIAVGIDTSGSTNEYINRFLSELNGLISNFNYELHVIQCDTEVGSYQKYDNDNPLDLGLQYSVTGGGGTTLKPIFDYIEDHQLDVDCIAVMTDGYCEEFTSENTPKLPIIWCVTPDGSTKNLKVGETAMLDKAF